MKPLEIIWEQFLALVKEEAGSRVVETWLKAVSIIRWDSLQKTIYLHAPNHFVKDWVRRNYLNLLTNHLKRLLNVESLQVVFSDTKEHVEDQVVSTEEKIIPAQPLKKIIVPGTALMRTASRNYQQLNENYIFDTFVVGSHNQMAYAAARAITKKLGTLYNPLFLYGDSGHGKTHLLCAIANEIRSEYKNIVVLYQPAEKFVNEFITAIRFDKIHKFQEKYRTVDVLLIDDIQCISNKEQTQEAFFNIFNALYNQHKQIVFSGDSYPADMRGIADRLRSRLEMGLIADILSPTLETKIAILQRKADLHNYKISDDIIDFIASQASSNIRELEGALIRVVASASLTGQPLTLEFAQSILIRSKGKKAEVTLDSITKILQKHYECTSKELRSKDRSKNVALVRHIGMYLMKKLTTKSLYEIAVFWGRKDHSTVSHALRHIDERMQKNADFKKHIERIEQELA